MFGLHGSMSPLNEEGRENWDSVGMAEGLKDPRDSEETRGYAQAQARTPMTGFHSRGMRSLM